MSITWFFNGVRWIVRIFWKNNQIAQIEADSEKQCIAFSDAIHNPIQR